MLLVGGTTVAIVSTNQEGRQSLAEGIASGLEAVSEVVDESADKLKNIVFASSGGKPLPHDEEVQVGRLTKGIDKFIEDHPDLAEEAEKVAQGEALPKGEDHVREAEDWIRSLEKGLRVLRENRDKRNPEGQEAIDRAIENGQKQLDYLRDLLSP